MGFGEAKTEAGRQVQRCCPSPTMGNSSPGCQPSDKTCDPLWLLQPALRGQEALGLTQKAALKKKQAQPVTNETNKPASSPARERP